jgi:hypothetical protein
MKRKKKQHIFLFDVGCIEEGAVKEGRRDRNGELVRIRNVKS